MTTAISFTVRKNYKGYRIEKRFGFFYAYKKDETLVWEDNSMKNMKAKLDTF